MDKPSQSAWTKTTQSGETKYQNPGRQNIPICRHKRNPERQNITILDCDIFSLSGYCCFVHPDCDVLSSRIMMFFLYTYCDVLSIRIVMFFSPECDVFFYRECDGLSIGMVMFCLSVW
jgi:hypothetical protein